MSRPTLAETGRFVAIVFAVLLACYLARALLFDGPGEDLAALDVVVSIAVAVVIMGGWLRRGVGKP